jgi:hypothetical protein
MAARTASQAVQATDKVPGSSDKQRRRGSTRSKLMINERRKVRVAAPRGQQRIAQRQQIGGAKGGPARCDQPELVRRVYIGER